MTVALHSSVAGHARILTAPGHIHSKEEEETVGRVPHRQCPPGALRLSPTRLSTPIP